MPRRRRKAQVEGTELVNVNVERISLVPAGANQMPFKIMKTDGKEKPMSIFKKSSRNPRVAAVLVSDEANLGPIRERLKAAGLAVDIEKSDEEAGCVVFPQVKGYEQVGDNDVVIKHDDNVAVVVRNVRKSFEGINWESTVFSDVMAQEGFVPSIGLATDMLQSTYINILNKAETQEELTSMFSKAVRDYGKLVDVLTSATTDEMFSVSLFKAAEDEDGDGEGDDDGADEDDGDEVETGAEGDDDNDGEGDGDGDEETSQASGEIEPAVAAAVAEAVEPINDAVAKIAGSLDTITDAVQKTAEQVEGLNKRVKAAEKTAKAAKAATDGMVSSEPDDDGDAAARKSDDDSPAGEPAFIDTAHGRPAA